MKITVLDRNTVEKMGDIDWSPVCSLAEVEFFDQLTDSELTEAAKDSDAIIVNKKVITAGIMDGLPKLRLILLFATGYNNIDVVAAKERGISVCNVPGYSTDFVAQTVFSYILAFANSAAKYNKAVQEGKWVESTTFSFIDYPLIELRGKTLGIIGLGSIGSRVAEIGTAFGMNVIYSSRRKKDVPYNMVSADEVFEKSDFISVHCPLTPETRGLVDKRRLSLMKKTAYFINTSRGPVVDEQALSDALRKGAISGAAVDVLETEPMKGDCPLLGAPNIIITPHVAWAGKETRQRLIGIVADNIKAFQSGEPQNDITRLG